MKFDVKVGRESQNYSFKEQAFNLYIRVLWFGKLWSSWFGAAVHSGSEYSKNIAHNVLENI